MFMILNIKYRLAIIRLFLLKYVGNASISFNMNVITKIKRCIELGNQEELKILLARNPECIDAKFDKISGKSFLHLASELSDLETLKVLLSSGANPCLQDSEGNAPLHNAALNQDLNSCKLLIKFGANPKVQNNSGYGPFQAALNTKNKELIDYLRSVIYGQKAN